MSSNILFKCGVFTFVCMIWFLFRVNFLFRNYICTMQCALRVISTHKQHVGYVYMCVCVCVKCEWTGGVKVVALLNVSALYKIISLYLWLLHGPIAAEANTTKITSRRLEYRFEFQTENRCMEILSIFIWFEAIWEQKLC